MHVKTTILTALGLYLCFVMAGKAQNVTPKDTSYWKTNGQLGLFLNQAAFSTNWRAGGVNSLAFGGVAQFAAKYEKAKLNYAHDAQLNFGLVQNMGQGQRKTNDLIFIDNKLGYKIADKWDLFGSATFLSQFARGFKYVKDANGVEQEVYQSNFLAPAYLTEALGIEYRPVSYASVRFGLGGLRHTFVTDTANIYRAVEGNYGVAQGQYVRTQAIFQLQASFDKDIMQNVNLKARYLGLLDYGKISNLREGIVHRLDISVTAKVNKYISVNLGGILLYDADQDKNVQYSQSLALGFLYKFNN